MSADVVHRLGMAVPVAAVVVCVLSAIHEMRARRSVRRRAAALGGSPVRDITPLRRRRGARPGRVGHTVRAWATPITAGCATTLLIGGATGLALGLAVAYGVRQGQRRARTTASRSADETAVRAELAAAADLLAACLAAGAGPRESAEAVGRSLDGAIGARLRQVAAELRLGGDPATAWRPLADVPGAKGLARRMERAGTSGSPAAEGVSRTAAELRAESGRAATQRARRAGVLVTLPLAACFLPAFLTVGLAPVLIGLAEGLLASR
ncbi:type II secretion system F family protein [Streptomyces sp. NPDC003077]|uniref:type II secretion system F family protein n=1 Tax=Streptomyces sp. NPDC003077 TaxID=3154443 RepID=UPI0033B4EB4E